VKSELSPFFDRIRTLEKKDIAYFNEAYLDFKQRDKRASDIISFILRGGLEKFGTNMPLNDQIVDLFFYLGLVESLGNCYVDILVMLLVTNGRDFHLESRFSTPRIKHLVSIKELEREKVPLKAKLNFLEDNGIKCFTSVIDTQLRNDIAHLNFELKDDQVRLRNKPVTDVVTLCFDRFMLATRTIYELLYELAVDFGWEQPREKSKLEELMEDLKEGKIDPEKFGIGPPNP